MDSMRGSGIYSTDTEIVDHCPKCEREVDAVLFVDDWGRATITCMECESDWEPEEPDYEGPDFD